MYEMKVQTRQCLQGLSVSDVHLHKINNRMKINHLNSPPHQHQQNGVRNNAASLSVTLVVGDEKAFS